MSEHGEIPPRPAEEIPRQPRGKAALRARRAAAWGIEPTWDDRISDRLHPVLVRELRQAAGGRLLLLSSGGALWLLLLARDALPRGGAEWGADARGTTFKILAALAVVLLGVLPFRAFASLRGELGGDGREQILLSGLRPSGLILGKLQGALVLALLFLGLAGPVLAFCVALRGWSAAVILTAMAGLLVASLALAAIGLALAAATWRLQPSALPLSLGGVLFAWTAGRTVDALMDSRIALLQNLDQAIAAEGLRPGLVVVLSGLLVGAVGTALALRLLLGADTVQWRGEPLARVAPALPLLTLAGAALWPGGPWPADGMAPLAFALALPLLLLAASGPQPAIAFVTCLATATLIAGGGWIDPATTAARPAVATAWAALLLMIPGVVAAHRRALASGALKPSSPAGRIALRSAVTLLLVIGTPMLLNGLRAERIFDWNVLQACSPLAVLPQVRRVGFDTELFVALGSATALPWLAVLLWPRRKLATTPADHAESAEAAT